MISEKAKCVNGVATSTKRIIVFDLNGPIIETVNTEGKFEKKITLPEEKKDEEVTIKLMIPDKNGKESTAKSTLTKTIDSN